MTAKELKRKLAAILSADALANCLEEWTALHSSGDVKCQEVLNHKPDRDKEGKKIGNETGGDLGRLLSCMRFYRNVLDLCGDAWWYFIGSRR